MTDAQLAHPIDLKTFDDIAEHLRASGVDELTIFAVQTFGHREKQEGVLETTRTFGKEMISPGRFVDALENHSRRLHALLAAHTATSESDALDMGVHQMINDLIDDAERLGLAFDVLVDDLRSTTQKEVADAMAG
jgi:hypothetical protein